MPLLMCAAICPIPLLAPAKPVFPEITLMWNMCVHLHNGWTVVRSDGVGAIVYVRSEAGLVRGETRHQTT